MKCSNKPNSSEQKQKDVVIRKPTLWVNFNFACTLNIAVGYTRSIFTALKYATNAGVTTCLTMSAKMCPAVFVHLPAISHLQRRLRTSQNLRGNTDHEKRKVKMITIKAQLQQ